jgi:hypothetical protein
MKLTYRGAQYEYEPSNQEVTEGEIGGNYRGQPWHVHYPKHIPVPHSIKNLTYRSVAYSTGRPVAAKSQAVTRLAAALENNSIWSTRNPDVIDEAARIHLANIRSSLERRLAVAKAKGDENLVRMLEKESKQLSHSL